MKEPAHVVDCDDVIVMLAREPETLTGLERTQIGRHVAGCSACQALTEESNDDRWRWIARLPEDAFEDPDLLVLPVVDPVVFEPGDEIAKGGMGRITRARDRRLGREVAIKEVLEVDLRARFEREATITARLQHPAIVPIYEAGTWPNGSAFYTMRLVSGGTLAQAIDRTETLAQRLALLPHVVAATEALAYAHSRRIIHRDLKPHNVLVGEFGETVVIDWGLAKELDRDVESALPARRTSGGASDLTVVGSVLGTPCFMPPEQARGEELDERADVFALGAILYNVLVGDPPYWTKGDTAEKLIDAVLKSPPVPIAQLAPDAPEDLRAVVERAMARDLTARYPTAAEMAQELRRFQAGQLLVSREYRMRDLLARWFQRHRAPVLVAGVAALVLAVVGVIAVVNVARSRDAERDSRVVAESARGAADRSVAALLEEQGRSELLAGHTDRALAYLAEAYRRGHDSVALRHLLAEATREPDLLQRTLGTGDDRYGSIAIRPDGAVLGFVLGDKARVDVFSGDTIVDSYGLGVDAGGAVFSPDGTRALIVTDTALYGWDVEAGKQLWTLAGKYDRDSLVFDPTGARFAIVPSKKPVEVVEVATGKVSAKPASEDKAIAAVAFSNTGDLLATASEQGNVELWALTPKLELVASLRFPRELTDIAVSGDHVVVTTKEREIFVWEPTEANFHVLGGHRDDLTALAATPDGEYIATGDRSGGVKLWDGKGRLLGESAEPRGAIRVLRFSPDLTALVGGGEDTGAFVWNTSLGVRGILRAPGDDYDAIGSVVWGGKKTIATLDDSGKQIHVWKKPMSNLIVHQKGERIAVAGNTVAIVHGAQLIVRELAKGKKRSTLENVREPDKHYHQIDRPRVALSRDAGRALIWNEDGATIYDLHTNTALRVLAADPDNAPTMTAWLLARDGARVVELGDKRVRVHDLATGGIAFAHDLPERVGPGGDLSSSGQRIVLAADTPVMWQVPSGAPVPLKEVDLTRKLRRHDGRELSVSTGPNDIAFDPTGVRFIVLETTIPVVVDAATGDTINRLESAKNVDGGALDDGGRTAVTQSSGSTNVWDVATGAIRFAVPGTAEHAFAISHDGARIATGHPDGTVRIWDARGRLLETIRGHRDAIETLAFSDDATRLVIGALDGWVSIWDVHLEQRSPAEISAFAATHSSWQVVNGALAPKPH